MAQASAEESNPVDLGQIAEPHYHQRTVGWFLKEMQLRIRFICHKIYGDAANDSKETAPERVAA